MKITIKITLIALLLCSCSLAFQRNSWATNKVEIHTAKLQDQVQTITKTINFGLEFANLPQVFAYFERIAWDNAATNEELINYDLNIAQNSINLTHFDLTLTLNKGGKQFHGYIKWVAYDDSLLYAGSVLYPSYTKFEFKTDRGAPKYAVTFLQSAQYTGPADAIQVSINNITDSFIQVNFDAPSTLKLKSARALVLMWYDEVKCMGFEYSSKTFQDSEKQIQPISIKYPIYDEDLKFNPILVFTGLRGYNAKVSQIDISAGVASQHTNLDTNIVTVNTEVGSTRAQVNQVFWTQVVCQELGARIEFDVTTTIDPFVNGIFLTSFIGGALFLIAIFTILAKPTEEEMRKKKNPEQHVHGCDEEKNLNKK